MTSREIADQLPELWIGHALNPHTWPDVDAAIRLANEKLTQGLERQELGLITIAGRWLGNISEVLIQRTIEIEEEERHGRMDRRRR